MAYCLNDILKSNLACLKHSTYIIDYLVTQVNYMPVSGTFRALLLTTARLFSEEVNMLLEPYGLNYSLWRVLYTIQSKSICTSIEIAEYLNISKPAVAKRIQLLLQLRLLQQLDSSDKRQKVLTLSDTGLALFQKCSRDIEQFEHLVTQQISPEQLELSKNTLKTVMHQLQQMKTGAI